MQTHNSYRLASILAVTTGLILVWMNLAVGIIGSEDNPANALYIGVIVVACIGSLIERFRARGLMKVMLTTALVQFLVPITAIIIWKPSFSVGVLGVLVLNGIFVALWLSSAWLFRKAHTNKAV